MLTTNRISRRWQAGSYRHLTVIFERCKFIRKPFFKGFGKKIVEMIKDGAFRTPGRMRS